jgi:hypothetical protein
MVALLLCLACTASNAGDEPETAPRLARAIAKMDQVFGPSFDWWAKVYDPDSGGFFYSLSARNNARFGADIEATQKAIRVLEWSGVLDKTPAAFRDRVVRFMQQRQDAKSGFFYDPQNRNEYSHNSRSRALGMATQVLELCGGKAQHPLPLERLKENKESAEHYAHLASPKAFRAWIDQLFLTSRAWTAGARIRTQAETLQEMEEPLRTQLLDVLVDVFKAQQKSDGLVGQPKDKWFSRLSGTYKIASCLEMNGRAIPEAKTIMRTVLHRLDHTDYDSLIVLYNTVNVLSILDRTTGCFDVSRKAAIIERFTELLKPFQAKDGGFTTQRGRGNPLAHGFILAENVIEGDTNATGLAHKSRMLLHEMARNRKGPAPHPRAPELVEALRKRLKQ